MIFRIHFWRGYHIRMRLYVAERADRGALAHCGELVMRPGEFEALREICKNCAFEWVDKTEQPAKPTEKEMDYERSRKQRRR